LTQGGLILLVGDGFRLLSHSNCISTTTKRKEKLTMSA